MAEPSLFSNPEKKLKYRSSVALPKIVSKVMQLPPVKLLNTCECSMWPRIAPKLLIMAFVLRAAGCTHCWHTHSLPGSVKCAEAASHRHLQTTGSRPGVGEGGRCTRHQPSVTIFSVLSDCGQVCLQF